MLLFRIWEGFLVFTALAMASLRRGAAAGGHDIVMYLTG